jgi:glycosyltransferase involved in cell wall biosynthesis/GT2 family glycosyltransferase
VRRKKAHFARIPDHARRLKASAKNVAGLLQEGAYDEILSKLKRRLRPPVVELGVLSGSGSWAPLAGAAEAHARTAELALDTFLGSGQALSLPRSERPELSVLIVASGGPAGVLDCLRSVLEQRDASEHEVLVVDDAAPAETSALLTRFHGLDVTRYDERRGPAAAVKHMATRARGEFLLVLADAAALLPSALHSALFALKAQPEPAIVCGRVIDVAGTLLHAGGIVWKDGTIEAYGMGGNPRAPEYMFAREVDCGSGAILSLRKATYDAVGGLDDAYSEPGLCFADLCLRARRLGAVVYDPRIVVSAAGATTGARDSSFGELTARADHERFIAAHGSLLSVQPVREAKNRLAARSPRRRPRLLFIEDRAPHPHLGMGYPRSFEMLWIACNAGYDVTLLPTIVPDEPWPSVYADLPRFVEVVLGYPRERIPDFLATRVGFFDVMMVARPHNMAPFSSAMQKHPSWFRGVRIVYDAEALFCLRNSAYQELIGQPWSPERIDEEVEAEVELTRGADVVFSVSPWERAQFERHGVKDARLLIHTTEVNPGPRPFAQRRDILFVGSMHFHPSPNSDSIIWFVREVFPLIRAQVSDVRLTIAGVNKTREVAALADDAVRVVGMVPELDPLFDAFRLFVAPTRYAAGVPIKVCEASARGIPCVTSNLVASQLGWHSGHALLSAPTSDPEAFARHCVSLYSDEPLWNRIRTNALALVEELCSRRTFADTLRSALAGV